MPRAIIYIVCIFHCWSTFLIAGSGEQIKTHSFGRTWWQAGGPSERLGFVSGYLDCLDFNGLSSSSDASDHELSAHISNYYATDASHERLDAGSVLEEIGKLRQPRPDKSAELGVGGEYWRKSSGDERTGYVEGFVVCSANKKKATYPSPVASYVSLISKWYGISTIDESIIDPSRANTPVATVIDHIKD